MNEVAFVEKREADWKRLTFLCDRADATIKSLKPDELHEFVRLYRRASADLALARTKSSNLQLIDYLNDLAGRAYSILYRAPRNPFRKAIGSAIRQSAQTVRRCRIFVLVSASLFVGSALLSYTLMRYVPETRDFFVPEVMRENFDQWKSGIHEARSGSESLGATGMYATNNPFVSILTGSVAAATFGIGTAERMYFNGAILGALAYEMDTVGKLGYLLASVLPHGVPELSGIVIAGSAGFLMGWALINPGRRKRGEALKAAGRDAVVLLMTSVVLMFIAAPIEGFFSFNPNVSSPVKVVVIAVEVILWGVFWTGFGRDREPAPALGV
ncbi:MAG: stage II sporulation protein M [Fimbriimonadaceae bacterium]|nr:stage II sporulation protein M [Fimbriimonadaceae bacterium]